MTLIDIDRSLHSGSGVLVRRAVAQAALTGRPVHCAMPGLAAGSPDCAPQHLRAIQAMRDLAGGSVDRAAVGSQSFEFRPGDAEHAGRYAWDIGTADSATMLALAVLPVLAFRGHGAEAEIRGPHSRTSRRRYFTCST